MTKTIIGNFDLNSNEVLNWLGQYGYSEYRVGYRQDVSSYELVAQQRSFGELPPGYTEIDR